MTITDWNTKVDAKAYAREGLIWQHGKAKLSIHFRKLSFGITPKLIKGKEHRNDLDYHISKVKVDLRPGDVKIDYISIGWLPNWILNGICQIILDTILFSSYIFSPIFNLIIKAGLNMMRAEIPDELQIPNTDFSLSLSFPDVPRFYEDHQIMPLDGSLYVTEFGYDPLNDPAVPMPCDDESEKSNVITFFNEYVPNSWLTSMKHTGDMVPLQSAAFKTIGLPDLTMYKEVLELFPRVKCDVAADTQFQVSFGLDSELDSHV